MADTNGVPSERLDSWKAIAAYLDRDMRTVRRWEKTLGLPVRRVAGRGRSVFAYISEIDAWLASHPLEQRGPAAPAPRVEAPSAHTPAEIPRAPRRRWLWAAAAVSVLLTTALAWAARGRAPAEPVSVRVTHSAIVATDARGDEQWRSVAPAGERLIPATSHPDRPEFYTGAERKEVIVGTGYRERLADRRMSSGELLWFTRDGRRTRQFAFDDRLVFGAGVFGGPWAITTFSRDERDGRRIAVAAHHHLWWPSVVAILDEEGARRGTFVNAGWVEGIRWLSPQRLLIAGFSNARDGGMVAMLDAARMDGQSPVADDASFRCTSCGNGAPLRYIVLPRSEVNIATVSPFNRAILTATGDRVIVRTLEVASAGADAVDALYEFTPQLDLVRASYSDRYWETHRALETHGKLNHSRAQCPQSRGPLAIHVWEPRSGWATVRLPRD